jgi:hypothetical protein
MSYALKATGVAANCIIAVVVDDDGSTIMDVAGANAGTAEGTVSVATGSWNGTARNYISIPASTDYGIDFGAGNLAAVEVQDATSKKATIVALVDDWAAGAGGRETFAIASSADFEFRLRKGSYGDAAIYMQCGAGGVYWTNAANSTSAQQLLAFVLDEGAKGPMYEGLHDASAVSSTTLAAGSTNVAAKTFTPRYIGRSSLSSQSSMNAKLYGFFVFNKDLSEAEVNEILDDPWGALFEGSGGGATATADPRLGRWRRMPTRMVSGAWRYVRTLVDAAANLAANVFNVTMSETGSATDSLSAQLSAAVSLAEAANAADAISNALTSARSFTEAGGATDTLTTTATFPRSIGTEAGSAGDSLSSSVGGFDVTIAETATAVDSISALLNAAVTLAEAGSATDSYSNLATLLAALAESVTATDTYSSALNGGNYSVSFTEAATAVDSIAAQVAWARDVAETGNATDTTSAQAAFQRALAEAAAALDLVATGGITNVSISEAGSATDLVSAPTGFGEVPPERVITIQLADRVVRITKTRRPIRVLN